MVQFNFNANEVEPDTGSAGQLPASPPEHLLVTITNSEKIATKDNPNNFYLDLTLTVAEGEHKGRSGSMKLNMWNDNQDTVRISAAQLSAICHVVGIYDVKDSSQLHNVPFRVRTEITDIEKGYSRVKGIYDANGNRPRKGGVQQPTQAAQPAEAEWASSPPNNVQSATTDPNTPPWAK